jgi:ionotropic glutamate receptor
MLTVPQLPPSVIQGDVGWLKKNNLTVGCDGDSFVRTYLNNVVGFNPQNILNVTSEYNYTREFETNNISAAFLELPYEKVLLNKYCNGYIGSRPTNRFGGLGFVSSNSPSLFLSKSTTKENKKIFFSLDADIPERLSNGQGFF